MDQLVNRQLLVRRADREYSSVSAAVTPEVQSAHALPVLSKATSMGNSDIFSGGGGGGGVMAFNPFFPLASTAAAGKPLVAPPASLAHGHAPASSAHCHWQQSSGSSAQCQYHEEEGYGNEHRQVHDDELEETDEEEAVTVFGRISLCGLQQMKAGRFPAADAGKADAVAVGTALLEQPSTASLYLLELDCALRSYEGGRQPAVLKGSQVPALNQEANQSATALIASLLSTTEQSRHGYLAALRAGLSGYLRTAIHSATTALLHRRLTEAAQTQTAAPVEQGRAPSLSPAASVGSPTPVSNGDIAWQGPTSPHSDAMAIGSNFSALPSDNYHEHAQPSNGMAGGQTIIGSKRGRDSGAITGAADGSSSGYNSKSSSLALAAATGSKVDLPLEAQQSSRPAQRSRLNSGPSTPATLHPGHDSCS